MIVKNYDSNGVKYWEKQITKHLNNTGHALVALKDLLAEREDREFIDAIIAKKNTMYQEVRDVIDGLISSRRQPTCTYGNDDIYGLRQEIALLRIEIADLKADIFLRKED
jgi:hypothetical protein